MKLASSKKSRDGRRQITSETNQQGVGLLNKIQALIAHGIQDAPESPEEASSRRIAQLLSRAEVAQRWGCCPHTVARRKDLKPVRFNKRMLRYRLADVEAVESAGVA
jgi:hypothetical protein